MLAEALIKEDLQLAMQSTAEEVCKQEITQILEGNRLTLEALLVPEVHLEVSTVIMESVNLELDITLEEICPESAQLELILAQLHRAVIPLPQVRRPPSQIRRVQVPRRSVSHRLEVHRLPAVRRRLAVQLTSAEVHSKEEVLQVAAQLTSAEVRMRPARAESTLGVVPVIRLTMGVFIH